MTIQSTHQPTTVARPAGAPRHLTRWLVPVGLAATVAATFVVVETVRDDGGDAATRSIAAATVSTIDYTRSQRRIDNAIADAIAETIADR